MLLLPVSSPEVHTETSKKKQNEIERKLQKGKEIVQETKDQRAEAEMVEIHNQCMAEPRRRDAKKVHIDREHTKEDKEDNKENLV
ncbi:MAG: hypothetical protein BYD32DRAFT_456891 [Podila humilis]|nr:MAG: hypothetical protein BYD32DRAFT_456891 [Podila humilis]